MSTKLKCVSIYLSDAEYKNFKKEADDYEVSISAYLRAVLKLPTITRGAPIGNDNGRGNRKKRTQTGENG